MTIDSDTPLRLDKAAALAFPDGSVKAILVWLKPQLRKYHSLTPSEKMTVRGYIHYIERCYEETKHPILLRYVKAARKVISRNLPKEPGSGFVYFVRAGNDIKIGFSVTPKKRVHALQIGCPINVELLAIIPGTIDIERELHRRFFGLHVRGEWFRADNDLLSYIQSVREEGIPKIHEGSE